MPKLKVTTWYLEMTARSQLRPARPPRVPVDVVRAEVPNPEFARFLYQAVGGPWYWTDRLGWTRERWLAHLDRPEVETWVALAGGTPAGYAELEEQPGGQVEIAYFGLLPQFTGQGIGGHLLTEAVARAWDREAAHPDRRATRVWVHTCSLDGPHALANYQARGFRVYDTRTALEELPDRPPTFWTGTPPRG
jgi:ribosomal protein S18 acetylase RimI-like enzyme